MVNDILKLQKSMPFWVINSGSKSQSLTHEPHTQEAVPKELFFFYLGFKNIPLNVPKDKTVQMSP